MIRLYNTLTRKIEDFKPIQKGRVGLYTCGPTVYNFAHIGNLRTYIFEDILRRTLEYAGFKVEHIMNTTDIDDKTIQGAREAGKSLEEFTRHYEKIFLQDLGALHILPPTKLVRASGHIPDMIALIERLLKCGIAYEKDGSVYFAVSKFPNYGKLARLDIGGMKAGARVDVDEYEKEDVKDFALWKGKKEGEPSWPAHFGKGRPGWHIECSAMSMKYLGETFDIHAGGVDLIFPHHENEIAQSEAATGKEFVRWWIHGEHLLVDGKKMAKSSGNFYTLRELEKRKSNPLAFRYLVLTSHYRSKLNFTWTSLQAAENALDRIYNIVYILRNKVNEKGKQYYENDFQEIEDDFFYSLYNDLDTPTAIANLQSLIRAYYRSSESYDPEITLDLLYKFDTILGFGLKNIEEPIIPSEILELAEKRQVYKLDRRLDEADTIRKQIEERGFLVQDTIQGPKIRKK